jgi:hypothetical protein
VALTFDLVQCSHPTTDALQELLAFGTQSFACRNFDHSRLVDTRGAQKQLRCGLGWHGGSLRIEREPERSLSHRRSVVMPLMALTVAYPTVVPQGSRQTKVERVARPTVFCEHQSNAQNDHCEYRNRPLSRSGSGGRCRPATKPVYRVAMVRDDTESTLRSSCRAR